MTTAERQVAEALRIAEEDMEEFIRHAQSRKGILYDAIMLAVRLQEKIDDTFLKGRLFQFERMKRERPIDPIYWDTHEENEIREKLADSLSS